VPHLWTLRDRLLVSIAAIMANEGVTSRNPLTIRFRK
jgi:uncharacterized Tic20 family protein